MGYLFDDKPHILTGSMSDWLTSSRRFKSFTTTYRDKIRKKIRMTQDSESIQDLQVELECAYWLLQERRFNLVYEPYSSEKIRGPDFAVAFKSTTFNVEVTRIRLPAAERPQPVSDSVATETPGSEYANGRLLDTVGDKLGQMRPGMANLLLVAAGHPFVRVLDLDQAMVQLKERAERKDAVLFGRHGFGGSSDFFKHYLRLSAILARSAGDSDRAVPSHLWLNNQAKHPLPTPVQTILLRNN